MTSESERLEREAENARSRLQATLEELRAQATPGALVDQAIEYLRRGPAGRLFRRIAREAQENPLPLVLIGIGVAWFALSANRSSRAAIADAADRVSRKAADLASRARDVGSGVAERAQEVSAMTAAVIGKEKWPLAGAPEGGSGPSGPAPRRRQPVEIGDES